jgi:putative transposase
VIVKRRRLPHWDATGQPLFVTFRLRDSLPASRPFPASDLTSGEAFLTMDRLLDQARCGPTFLRKHAIAELVLASLQHGSEIEHYELHSWVIMPSHLHLLLTPQVSLSKLLGSLKAATAKRANLFLQRTGQPFWQDESYDHLVRSGDEFQRIRRYIENNPVAAGLAGTPEQYLWSSARESNVTDTGSGAGPRPAPGALARLFDNSTRSEGRMCPSGKTK